MLAPRSHRRPIISSLFLCCVTPIRIIRAIRFERSSLRQNVAPQQLQRRESRLMRLRPVLKLHARLHRTVIAADDLAHPARIAAAPHILQQQRKVEAAPLLIRQPDLVGNPHPQQTAAQGMAPHRALSQIKGKGERRDDLRQRDRTIAVPSILPKEGRRLNHAGIRSCKRRQKVWSPGRSQVQSWPVMHLLQDSTARIASAQAARYSPKDAELWPLRGIFQSGKPLSRGAFAPAPIAYNRAYARCCMR